MTMPSLFILVLSISHIFLFIIPQGENDWVVKMMLASVEGVGGSVLEGEVPHAMADVTDHLVNKTALLQQAQQKRRSMRKVSMAV